MRSPHFGRMRRCMGNSVENETIEAIPFQERSDGFLLRFRAAGKKYLMLPKIFVSFFGGREFIKV